MELALFAAAVLWSVLAVFAALAFGWAIVDPDDVPPAPAAGAGPT